jgi:hypothetical protein
MEEFYKNDGHKAYQIRLLMAINHVLSAFGVDEYVESSELQKDSERIEENQIRIQISNNIEPQEDSKRSNGDNSETKESEDSINENSIKNSKKLVF